MRSRYDTLPTARCQHGVCPPFCGTHRKIGAEAFVRLPLCCRRVTWTLPEDSEAVWKQSLYTRRGYVIYRARLRTDLLDNRSLDMLLEISKRLIY
jgi:hypothetical protein